MVGLFAEWAFLFFLALRAFLYVVLSYAGLASPFASLEEGGVLEEVDVLFPFGFLAGGSSAWVTASTGMAHSMGGSFTYVWGS